MCLSWLLPVMHHFHARRRVDIWVFLAALLLACSWHVSGSPVTLTVSDTSAGNTAATLTGRFTPTSYVPAFSSLIVTLSGTNVFPSGSTSPQVTVAPAGQVSADDKVRFERFNNIGHSPSYRAGLLADPNYASNTPQLAFFRSFISFESAQPPEDHFAWRVTGAICPTTTGQYEFVLDSVDDMMELHIARDDSSSFEQVMSAELTPSPPHVVFPVRQIYSMDALHRYPFILLFVENNQNDYLRFKWRVPGGSTDEEIPSSAFCTGSSNFNDGVLRVRFSWALLPGTEVTFRITVAPNPLCPLPANAQVSSAILVPQIPLVNAISSTIVPSSSGIYPAFTSPPLLLSLSFGSIDNSRVLNISFTPLVSLSNARAFIITLTGTGISISGNHVTFVSPFALAASATFTNPDLVLAVQIPASSFPSQAPIIFTVGNVTSAHASSGLSDIRAAVASASGACLARTTEGLFPAVPRSRWVFSCGASSNGWSC